MIAARVKLFSIFSLACVSCFSSSAQSAGFYLQEQSVSGQGYAFAGAAANPEDATTIFFNPAGMTSLGSAQMAAGASLVIPRAKFTDNGSTAGLTAGGQAPFASSGPGGDPFSPKLLPNLYGAMPLSDGRYWIGIGVSAPFGLANEYDNGWFGRYESLESRLKTIDISPVFAARIGNTLSIGGGPNIQYADALLETALPCPNVGFGCGAAFDPSSDGLSRLEGDNWDVGFNIGAMWDATESTRVGLHYRSAMSNDIPGIVTVSGLTGALAPNNGSQTATAKLKLPDIVSLGVSHQINDTVKVLGSINRFGWDNFDTIPVVFDDGSPPSYSPQNYEDSYSFALGAEWKKSETITWRGGVQYDKTPTTDGDRSSRTPDGDRFWVSLGASYQLNEHMSIDAAATHIFMEDGKINLDKRIYEGTAADTTVNINGTSDNSLDILSLAAVWRF